MLVIFKTHQAPNEDTENRKNDDAFPIDSIIIRNFGNEIKYS